MEVKSNIVETGGEKDIMILEDGVMGLSAEGGDIRRVSASIAIEPAAEKRLVWKFDLRILPTLAVMYLFNSLDKSNLGNAKTAGLEKTLKLKGNDYNLILSIFFIPYVLTAPFLAMAGKKFGPSRVLPCMMFSFGFFTLLVITTMNFGGLLALRWMLGMSESGESYNDFLMRRHILRKAFSILPARYLLPDNVLSSRRAGSSARFVLCCLFYCIGIWRPPLLWCFPDQVGQPCRLEISLHH